MWNYSIFSILGIFILRTRLHSTNLFGPDYETDTFLVLRSLCIHYRNYKNVNTFPTRTLLRLNNASHFHEFYAKNLDSSNFFKSFFFLFQQIHSSAFKDLRILVELNLSHNNLTHIEQDTFSGNERLQVSIFLRIIMYL